MIIFTDQCQERALAGASCDPQTSAEADLFCADLMRNEIANCLSVCERV